MAGNAAPAAMMPVMSNTHAGVLQDASTAVTAIQRPVAKAKNQPARRAHRRLRSILARGSAAAPSFCARPSANSAAVSTPCCTTVRKPSRRPVFKSTAMYLETYCGSGFSGVAAGGLTAGEAGVEAPPAGSASPRIEARICSSRECPAICTLACCTSIIRPCTEF